MYENLKENKQEKKPATKPGWIRNLEQKIVSLRFKIAHSELILFPLISVRFPTKLSNYL